MLPFAASRQIWQQTQGLKKVYLVHLISAYYWNEHLNTFCGWELAETKVQTSTRLGAYPVMDFAPQQLRFRQELPPLQMTMTTDDTGGLATTGDPDRIHWDTIASFNALPSSAQGSVAHRHGLFPAISARSPKQRGMLLPKGADLHPRLFRALFIHASRLTSFSKTQNTEFARATQNEQ